MTAWEVTTYALRVPWGFIAIATLTALLVGYGLATAGPDRLVAIALAIGVMAAVLLVDVILRRRSRTRS